MQSYFSGRYLKVLFDKFNAFDGVSSRWNKVTVGVPLGWILGPLHYLIAINSLPKIRDKNVQVVLFADDTSIIVNTQEILQTA